MILGSTTEDSASGDKDVDPAQVTAQFETAVAKAMTDAAPPPTATFTEVPVPSNTPLPSDTPEPSFTPEPTDSPTPAVEPTSSDPWVLQPWCEDHVGCERLEVKNQTDEWANVFLEFTDTGVNKFFSIPPRGHAWIRLRPGYYKYIFTVCGGKKVWDGTHGLNQHWYVIFKQKWCTN